MTCTAIHVVIEMVIKEKGGVQVGHVCNLGYGKKKKFVLYMYHMYMYVLVYMYTVHMYHISRVLALNL
jgi:hypothetical protein